MLCFEIHGKYFVGRTLPVFRLGNIDTIINKWYDDIVVSSVFVIMTENINVYFIDRVVLLFVIFWSKDKPSPIEYNIRSAG